MRAKTEMIAGVSYEKIDDQGLHIRVAGEDRLVECDSIVVCAGQDSVTDLAGEFSESHIIGGAKLARELDAQRAIEEGLLLANSL